MLRIKISSFVRLATTTAILMATGSFAFNLPSASPAIAKCQPSVYHSYRTNNGDEYQDGLLKAPTGALGGIYAEIRNYSPWVDPNPDPHGHTPASVAWVMLQRNSGTAYWAQVGWMEVGYGQRYTFTQTMSSGGSPVTHLYGARPTNGYTYYTVLYAAGSPGTFTFQYRDSNQGSPTTLEQQSTSWSPTYASLSSEITTYSNQMAGWLSDTEGFYDAHWYVGGWAYTTFDASSRVIRDATTGLTTTEFKMDGPYYGYQTYTWDGACS